MAGMNAPQSATATVHISGGGTFCVRDVTARAEKIDVRAFLDNRAGRRYTSIVTVLNGSRVPALHAHAARVAAPPHAVLAALAALRAALRGADGADMFAVLVRGEGREDAALDAAACNVAPRLRCARPAGVDVQVGGAPRARPRRKCASWSARRRPLEEARGAACAETVLADARGAMYEGLVTNLFVVVDDRTVLTAPDHAVLNGVMRAAVLHACRESGVTVVRQFPEMKDAARFRAAFLTSVARIVQPVHSFWWNGRQFIVQGGTQWDELLDAIRHAVWNRMLSEAVALPVSTGEEDVHLAGDIRLEAGINGKGGDSTSVGNGLIGK